MNMLLFCAQAPGSGYISAPSDSAILCIWCQRWDSTREISEQRTLIALHNEYLEVVDSRIWDGVTREVGWTNGEDGQGPGETWTRDWTGAGKTRRRDCEGCASKELDFMRTQMEQLMTETAEAPPRELKPTTGYLLTVKLVNSQFLRLKSWC